MEEKAQIRTFSSVQIFSWALLGLGPVSAKKCRCESFCTLTLAGSTVNFLGTFSFDL
jgi:hypothetical protein